MKTTTVLRLGLLALVIALAFLLLPQAFLPPQAVPQQLVRPVWAGPSTIIDGFDVSQTLIQTGVGVTSSVATGSTNLIGSARKLRVEVTGGAQSLRSGTSASRFTHNPDALVYGKTTITWDGTSADPDVLAFSLNANLSADNTIIVKLVEINFNSTMTMTVYTGSANYCSRRTQSVTGGLSGSSAPRAIIFRYTDFNQACGSGGVTWSDVDAIVFEIDTTDNSSNDITLDLVESGLLDLGDLPSIAQGGYPNSYTLYADGGAVHGRDTSLQLGSCWDQETDGQQDSNAVGDDNNKPNPPNCDDEDGVTPNTTVEWTAGIQVSVTVSISGTGCLSAWIDWGKNNDFTSTNDRVINNDTVSTGDKIYTFTVPSDVSSPYVYFSRWRLFSRNATDGCPSSGSPLPYDGQYYGGEVEDHKIGRSPTAVALSSLKAESADMPLLPLAVVALVGVGALGAVILARRRR